MMRLLEFCILLCVVQVGCWSRRRRSETEDARRRTKRSSEAIGNIIVKLDLFKPS